MLSLIPLIGLLRGNVWKLQEWGFYKSDAIPVALLTVLKYWSSYILTQLISHTKQYQSSIVLVWRREQRS